LLTKFTLRLISEKFDGIRAIWNATEREFYSKYGNKIKIPRWIPDVTPHGWLDGEFWY
jgi:ATP-dependent DNA ligase